MATDTKELLKEVRTRLASDFDSLHVFIDAAETSEMKAALRDVQSTLHDANVAVNKALNLFPAVPVGPNNAPPITDAGRGANHQRVGAPAQSAPIIVSAPSGGGGDGEAQS